MDRVVSVAVEPLGKHHDRAAFSCGIEELDDYLRRRARQDRDRRVAAVFVLTGEEPSTILGYDTLSSISIPLGELPEATVKRLPRYPDVPAVLLGRLAVAETLQRRGLGKFLLMDALKRALDRSQDVAAYALIAAAIDENAKRFYARCGFREYLDRPERLFLPMATIEQMFA